MNAIKKFLVMAISGLAFTGCFDMTEHPYTLLDASNYFTDENSIKQVIAHIYAQEQADLSEQYWYAQELSADQITWRSWNGGSWGWDSGDKFVLSTHTWNPSSNYVNRIWSGAWTAIGLAIGTYINWLIIAKRIKGEEALLEKELPGYKEYKEKVKYRLIPFIW